jgi:type II secretory pathway component HofQ
MIAVSDGLRATKAPAEAQSQAIRDRMSSIKISLNFTDTPLPEVVSFMSEVTQLNMVIDRKLIEDPDAKTVTFRVDELAFDQALDLIMKMANLGTQVQDGVVVITSREKVEADAAKAAAEKKALSEARKAQEELLARPVAFGGENLPLRDVADILAKGLGVPYRIDPKTWARPARYTIEERQRPASEIVALLRKGAPLVVAYREGILWFLSPDGVR